LSCLARQTVMMLTDITTSGQPNTQKPNRRGNGASTGDASNKYV